MKTTTTSGSGMTSIKDDPQAERIRKMFSWSSGWTK